MDKQVIPNAAITGNDVAVARDAERRAREPRMGQRT